MFKRLLEKYFGDGAWERVDHDEVERQLQAHREERALDYDRADEYLYSHYTEAVEDVKQLKRDRDHDAAEDLLRWCIEYVEREAVHHQEFDGTGAISPWYYQHLAIIYRKESRYDDEAAILERYIDACDNLGQTPKDELEERLNRTRELAASADS